MQKKDRDEKDPSPLAAWRAKIRPGTRLAALSFASSDPIAPDSVLDPGIATRLAPMADPGFRDAEQARMAETDLAPHAMLSASRGLPAVFTDRERALSGDHFWKRLAVAGARSLRYHFSDGTALDADQIHRHPLATVVDPLLLPRSPSSLLARERAAWPHLELVSSALGPFRNAWVAEVESVLGGVLAHAAPLIEAGELAFFLRFDQGAGPRFAIAIKHLVFGLADRWKWRVRCMPGDEVGRARATISLGPSDPESEIFAFGAFSLELPARALVFSRLDQQRQALRLLGVATGESGEKLERPAAEKADGENDDYDRGASRPKSEMSAASAGRNAAKLGIRGELRGNLRIASVVSWLRASPDELPIAIEPQSADIEPARRRPQISIDGGDGGAAATCSLSWAIDAPEFAAAPVVSGFSIGAMDALAALGLGLPAALGFAATAVATRARDRREWDLRLLKHSGLLAYAFCEAASVVASGALGDGTPLARPQELLRRLDRELGALLVAKEKLPGNRALSELCSKRAIAKLGEFVDGIFAEAERGDALVYGALGEFRLKGAFKLELAFIRALVLAVAAKTRGELFARPRSTPLQAAFAGALDDLTLLELAAGPAPRGFQIKLGEAIGATSPGELMDAFAPLLEQGFDILRNGERVVQLGEGEFRAELAIDESPRPPRGERAPARAGGEARAVAGTEAAPRETTRKATIGPTREDAEATEPGTGAAAIPGTEASIDWFALNPKFFLRGAPLDAALADDFLKSGFLEHEGRVYSLPRQQLPSLARLAKFWERLAKGKGPRPGSAWLTKIEQVPPNEVLEMLALRASGVPVSGGPRWAAICEFYDSLGQPREPIAMPASFRAELKAYQREGVQWLDDLRRLGLGGILGDDMGLGKTVQTLGALELWRQRGDLGHALIVVPSSLGFNWEAEALRFAPDLPLRRIGSGKDIEAAAAFLRESPGGALVVSYGMLAEKPDFFAQQRWSCAVFDEAQNLKNISAKRTSAARKLKADFKLALTGTPLENHFGELYSILDLVVPGCLGEPGAFMSRYVNPPSIPRADVDYLRLQAKPLLLRRAKSLIADQLGRKTESRVLIAFSPKQKNIYRDVAIAGNQRVREAIAKEGEAGSQLQMLTALLRLRQACSDPAALPGVSYREIPPKIATLMESLQEIVESGESALVFTQFLATLERVIGEARKASLPVFSLHGGLNATKREAALRGFNGTPGGAILAMTLKTGGVGLNLTKASYVFHLEPWWNPAVENQASDRAHRLGQNKHVQIFRYIMHESVEEKIELLKARKNARFQAMFAEAEVQEQAAPGAARARGALSREDFEYLLSSDQAGE